MIAVFCQIMVSQGSYSILATLCIYFVAPIFAKLPRFDHQSTENVSLSFLVVGDWGRQGLYNQSLVAKQMGKIGEKLDIGFVISTGDNFYEDGLKGLNDPAFLESFSNIYTAKTLQKKWYSVLGNHDYRGNVIVQISPILRKIDQRWVCLRSYMVNSGFAEFFFIDTTPFVDKYFNETDHTYDWRGVASQRIYVANLLKELEEALRQSSANWKIVVGHHTIRSIGHHGDTPELVEKLLPLLKATNVDLYINGHDHCLEHISSKDSPLQYLTSGAGSKAWRGDVKESHDDEVKFFYDGQGLMSLQITQTDADLVFYDVFGKILHQWKLSKPFYSSIFSSI